MLAAIASEPLLPKIQMQNHCQVASIASTPEPTDVEPMEDVPQEPFAPRFEICPEDTAVIEGDIAMLQDRVKYSNLYQYKIVNESSSTKLLFVKR